MATNEYDDLIQSDSKPASAQGDYGSIIEEDRASQKTALQGSMFVAARKEPDRHARVLELSKQTNLPADVVERNFDKIAKDRVVEGTDYDDLVRTSPNLSKWLEKPDNAAVARDDIDNLRKIEQSVQEHGFFSKMYDSLNVGLANLYSSTARVPALLYDVAALPQNLAAKALGRPEQQVQSPDWLINNPVAKYYDRAAESFRIPELEQDILKELSAGNYSKAGKALAAQFVSNLPQQAALLLGGLSGLGTAAAVQAGASTAADANLRSRESGVDPATATTNALTHGTLEAALEQAGTLGVLKSWENIIATKYGKAASGEIFKDFAKTLFHSALGEGTEEALTSIGQDFSDYVTGVNPDGLNGILGRAGNAGLLGATSGLAMTGPTATFAGYQRGAQARQSSMARDFYLALQNTAMATKLRERLPDAQRELVAQITKDTPVENIYIAPEAVETYFQSKNINPVSEMQKAGVLDAYTVARETGADVKIPIATWAHNFAATEHYAGLANDVKFSPDALSVNERKTVDEETRAELEKQAQEVKPVENEQQVDESAAKIRDQIAEQLKAVQDDPEKAVILERVFRTLGLSEGILPEEIFKLFPVSVQSEAPAQQAQASEGVPAGAQFEQAMRTEEAPVDRSGFRTEAVDSVIPDSHVPLQGKDLKQAAHAPGSFVNKDTGAEIRVTADTQRKAISYAKKVVSNKESKTKARQHVEALQHVGKLVENAVLVSESQDTKDRPGKWQYYFAPLEMDGKQYLAKLEVSDGVVHNYVLVDPRGLATQPDQGQVVAGSSGATSSPRGSYSIDDFMRLVKEARDRNTFFQSDGEVRGQINILTHQAVISLFKSKDASTFFHESGHYLFELTRRLAEREGASDRVKEIYAGLLSHLGVESHDQVTVEHHEQLAREFEAYVMEGKAPSSALRQAFARFRVWLVSVYRNVRGLNVELSPEVRSLFDRLLATDEEIDAAQAAQKMVPLFGDPKFLGMSEAKVKAYLKAQEAATEAAKEELNQKLMADHLRAQKAFYKEERAKAKERIEKEVNETRLYRAVSVLQKGTLPDGSPLPNGMQAIKLDRSALVAQYGEDFLKRLPRPTIYSKEGGLHPDVAAELLGFESGDSLVTQIANAPKRMELINQRADAEMQERYPDLLTNGKLPEEAMAAVHNEKRAALLRMELEYLAEHHMPVLKEVVRRVAKRVPSEKEVRNQAAEIIGKRSVQDLKPDLFRRAEVKAANEAAKLLAAGDIDGAFLAKRRELLNHELYRAAVDAREDVETTLEKFKKLARPDDKIVKTRDIDLVNAARAVLAQFGIGKTEERVASYLEKVKRYDPETFETVAALVDSTLEQAGFAQSYKDLDYNGFVALKDSVEAIWDLARTNRQIEIDGKMMDREEVAAELTERLAEISKPGNKEEYDRGVGAWEKTKMQLLGFKASLRRVEHWVSAVDGGQSIGAFRRYIWTPVKEAIDQYRSVKRQYIQRYLEMVKELAPHLSDKEIIATELVGSDGRVKVFKGKSELLGALLHAGNESNLSKLLRGYGWGTVNEAGELDRRRWDAFISRMQREEVLTKADYDFVQKVWDLNDELKVGAQKAHKQMYGTYFNEVTANEIVTPFGTYRGGYVPAVVDTLRSQDAAIRSDKESLEKNNNSFMFPTTGRGFTKSRVEQYSAPLVMDIGLIPSHLDKVLRFTHIEPKVKSVARLLTDKSFRKTLEAFDPSIATDMLIPWLQRAAQQKIETPAQGLGGKGLDRFWKALRTRTGLQMMTFNVINTMQNVAGFSLAMLKVDARYMRNGLFEYMRSPSQVSKMIAEKSTFMRNNMEESAAELQKTAEDIVVVPSATETVRNHAVKVGYFFQKSIQGAIDTVVWSGAYEQAVANGETEMDAVRLADAAVRETQGSFAAEDVSRAETGTPFMRLFTMFYSYFNMQANLVGSEFQKTIQDLGLRKGAGRLAYVYTMGFMVPAVVSELIARAMSGELGGDDDDEYLNDFLAIFFGSQAKTLTAMLPGGKAAELLATKTAKAVSGERPPPGRDDRLSMSPAVSSIESMLSAPASVYDAIANGGSRRKAVKDSLTFLGMMTGLPAAPLAKPVGYLFDMQDGKANPENPFQLVRGLSTGKVGKL